MILYSRMGVARINSSFAKQNLILRFANTISWHKFDPEVAQQETILHSRSKIWFCIREAKFDSSLRESVAQFVLTCSAAIIWST